jgi:hypothetical protein
MTGNNKKLKTKSRRYMSGRQAEDRGKGSTWFSRENEMNQKSLEKRFALAKEQSS